MKLYKTLRGILLEHSDSWHVLHADWDNLVNRDNLHGYLKNLASKAPSVDGAEARRWIEQGGMAPIGRQEVWAAGVTYLRSRDARMDEAKDSGGADLYDRVYDAVRPELFFKSLPERVMGSGVDVYIRRDSTWSVPEPELTLFINSAGSIQGYTVGNDMSSRSIEGENPLYLPQAKIYARSASIGPCLAVPEHPPAGNTKIEMTILRGGKQMYQDSTTIDRMKRGLPELAGFLFQEMDFPHGAYLMTGTCLVPPNEFTLTEGDIVHIAIDGIGTLTNTIAYKPPRIA